MPSIGIRELKAHASEIVRQVREKGAVYEVTVRGEVAARLVPTEASRPLSREAIEGWLREMDGLADEIGRLVDDGKAADEIMREERAEA
ncbi:MAG: type II toxin-antitoxin system Phd/YefM family antitoxin [Caldilineae bacterium]|nr:type II toxin-antitoxin system Phd/YefM family antitoxin [Chloroflexota bacterium]MCB9176030.1 type II toxin-antitoxin system Phd/YefM family antitoxin [Caldilineae bacterium]